MVVKRWTAARIGLWLALVSAGAGCSSSRQVTRSVTVEQPTPVVHPNWTPSSEAVAGQRQSGSSAESPSAEPVPAQPAPRVLRERILEGRADPVAPQQVAIVQTQNEVASEEPTPVASAAPIGNPLVANLLSDDHRLRLATIEVIEEASRDGYAFQEELPDENGVTVVVTLRWLAYGYDAKGAWVESSPDVRRRAMAAIAVVDPYFDDFNKPYCIDPDRVELAVAVPHSTADVTTPVITAASDPTADQTDTSNPVPGDNSIPGEIVAAAEPTVDAAIVREIPEIPENEPELAVVEETPAESPPTPPADSKVVDVLALTDTPTAEASRDLPYAEPQEEDAGTAAPRIVDESAISGGTDAPVASPSEATPVEEPTAAPVMEAEPVESVEAGRDLPATAAVAPEGVETQSEATPPVQSSGVAEPVETAEPEAPVPTREIPRAAEPPAKPAAEKPARSVVAPVPESSPPAARIPVPASSVPSETAQSVIPSDEPRSAGPLKGVIMSVEPRLGTAWVKFDSPRAVPSAGQRLMVIHRYPLGRLSSMGEVEIVRANTTHAEVRVIGGTPIAKVAVGDQVNSPSR